MAAKTDMERIGVFSESGYTTISDPYIPLSSSKSADPANNLHYRACKVNEYQGMHCSAG